MGIKKSNKIFYLIQVMAWGGLSFTSSFVVNVFTTEFIIYSAIATTVIGVSTTSLLRWYIKKYVSLHSITIKEVVKIVVATLLCSALYAFFSFSFGFVTGLLFGDELFNADMELMRKFNHPLLLVINSIFMIFGWLICYLVIKFFLKLNADRIERLQLQTSLKESQLNTLKGQINPHFMFNSLNNIRGLMLEDVERSREMLTRLSDMLRYSLTKNDTNSIALEEELEMVDNYVEISKIQFEERLHFVKEIDNNVLSSEIPPMIIQLLIENAIKHGISPLKKGGTVKLKVQRIPEGLSIEVSNTGKLIVAEGSTRVGLENIKKRLLLLYGPNASFSLNELNDEVIASILIPQP